MRTVYQKGKEALRPCLKTPIMLKSILSYSFNMLHKYAKIAHYEQFKKEKQPSRSAK